MSTPQPSTLRPVLAELPARPLNQQPKPAVSQTPSAEASSSCATRALTPPPTPPKLLHIETFTSTDGIETRHLAGSKNRKDQSAWDASTKVSRSGLQFYTKSYRLYNKLGHGVWSNVYLAFEVSEPSTPDLSQLSPPVSPTDNLGGLTSTTLESPVSRTSRMLAVKKPGRRDAAKVLEREAKMLTSLHLDEEASKYIVFFHGFDDAQKSIVLDAVPMTLDAYSRTARSCPPSTQTMLDPIIGAELWMTLADHLIGGLQFLHGKGCIHGDIKPMNVLLRIDQDQTITPLYCDFSSSRDATTTSAEKAEEISAVTADYTSPELLAALQSRERGRAVATFASDIFGLAVTLLFAAIAESPYACGKLNLQRLGMAKEGMPIEYARRSEQASRIMKGYAVDRVLQGALTKDPRDRWSIQDWGKIMQTVLKS
ncbi:hypothetical protein ACLMJK_000420 [Lecanora helva]